MEAVAYSICGANNDLSQQLVEFIEVGVRVFEVWYERMWLVTVNDEVCVAV